MDPRNKGGEAEGSTRSADCIGARLERLELRDDETENIILEEDDDERKADSKWVALGLL